MKAEVVNKVLGVVLSAALVFYLFPVSTGIGPIDRARYEEAEAVPIAVAPLAVFGTALAAYGIYVAASNANDYGTSLSSLFSDFVSGSGMTQQEIEALLTSSVTGAGAIALGNLGSSFFGMLQTWAQGLVSGGDAVTGASSAAANVGMLYVGNYGYRTWDYIPECYEDLIYNGQHQIERWNGERDLLAWGVFEESTNVNYKFVTSTHLNTESGFEGYFVNPSVRNGVNALSLWDAAIFTYYEYQDGRHDVTSWSGSSVELSGGDYVFSPTAQFASRYYDITRGGEALAPTVVAPDVAAGTAMVPDATVQPFEPTAAQLEAGYSMADVVEAVNAGTGATEGVGEQVGEIGETLQGVGDDVAAIGSSVGVIESIWTGLATTPFGWLSTFMSNVTNSWNSLLSWIGNTPLATLLAPLAGIGTIVAALTGNGGVLEWLGNTTASDLFAGVTGGLTGVVTALNADFSGLMTWLGNTPLATLLAPLAGIGTIAAALTGDAGVLEWLGNTTASDLFGTVTAGLSSVVTALNADFSGLMTWLGNTPLSVLLSPLAGIATIVSALTGQSGIIEWLGNTPIGDLFAGVSAGIASITGAVTAISAWLGVNPLATLWADVVSIASGVNDVSSWWGTLSGWWEGLNQWLGVDGILEGLTWDDVLASLLAGVLSGALSGTLADVIAAIRGAVLDVVGAIEGVTFPEIPELEWPKIEEKEPGDALPIALPPFGGGGDADFSRKAPFAYIAAFSETVQAIRFPSNTSFYFDLQMPEAGTVRFDASPWLMYQVNGVTVAYLLRIALTAGMCALLVGVAWKALKPAL